MGDHQAKHVRSVKDYLALRRNTSATVAALALVGFSLNLPEDVEKHPVMVSLKEGAVMLIAIVNVGLGLPSFFVCCQSFERIFQDIYSYVMEQSRGFESQCGHGRDARVPSRSQQCHGVARDLLEGRGVLLPGEYEASPFMGRRHRQARGRVCSWDGILGSQE